MLYLHYDKTGKLLIDYRLGLSLECAKKVLAGLLVFNQIRMVINRFVMLLGVLSRTCYSV